MAPPADAVTRLPRQHSGSGAHGVVVRVGNSANGVVYSVRLASNDLIVEELCEELVTSSDVPIGDQILLGGPPFTRLDPKRALSHYGLPARDKHVYLYDRRLLSQDNPLPPRLALEPVDFEFPTTPVASSENSRVLSESMSPLIRALPDYEAHFQLQLNQSEALERSSAANVAACERCVSELHVQAGAISAAIANLDTFRDTMNKHFLPFYTEFEAAAANHESLLTNFESHVSALKGVTLHPALKTDNRATLFDCVPVDREREWAGQCEQSHIAMRAQMARLKQVHDEIYEEVGALVRSQDQVSVAYADTTQELDRMKQFVAAHAEITAQLARNVESVSNKIAASASEVNTMFASTAMLDVCRDIEKLYQEQFESIPSAQKLAEEIKANMGKFSSVKASFFSRVHANLRKISVSQSKIRDFENSLAMLKEALNAQKKQFSELEHLQMLPEAYAACLKEIARRVRYGRRFSDRIQSMAEELAQMRDDEVHHREVFLRNFGQHMPRDFVPGLAEKPSHCEFRMRPFDQNLPQIEDVSDENAEGMRSGAASTTESKEEEEFFETRASDGMPHSGSNVEVDVLQRRCEELEAKVAELTLELQQNKKGSSYFSDGSLGRSDISKTSLREDDSSCEFPLVLALAATAGGMTSSSEADRSNLLERELQSLKGVKAETDSQDREKDARMAKLERDNQQYLLNATALEEEIQERTRRENQLLDTQAKLHQSVQALQLNFDTQRSALANVLKLLDLLPPHDRELSDPANFVASHLERIEARIRELTASAESERNLRRELAEKSDEINMLESQHLVVNNSFKISFLSFNFDDVALFLPTSAPGSDAQRVYLAFHIGCPHRFLSEESLPSFMIGGRKYPDYVIGRIVLIDEQVASEAHNPYNLQLGTTFFILTVASLQDL